MTKIDLEKRADRESRSCPGEFWPVFKGKSGQPGLEMDLNLGPG